ncbi:MAG TPA: hypothetical protein EYQ50_07320 [Verrucomicrobiales bacterium]|nr:hypothetical protein [Verrucomicrobiales bacterium]
MQNAFTNATIPDLISDLNAYTDPEISVTVENEGVVPTPGDYEGTLNYTLQLGPDSPPFGEWNWTLQGQWSFSFSADETSGISSWSHQYINNVVGGHLLTATTPSVQAFPNIPLAVQDDASGSHYWMDFSAASTTTLPSHELTFEPVSNLPIALPFTPGNTTISFSNGAAIALGNFMKEQGTPALNMRAPITCPDESIHFIVEVGAGQFLALEWTLTRIAAPLNTVPASGSGGGGSGGGGMEGMTLPISDIESDVNAGTVTISWASEESDVSYTVEASEDLMTWSVIGSVTSTSTGITSFVDEDAHSERSLRFYRVQFETP